MSGAGASWSISRERIDDIILKARTFSAEDVASGMEDGSNPSDDREIAALEPVGNPAEAELAAALEELNVDALSELAALMLVGRGDYSAAEYTDALGTVTSAADRNLITFLIGTPDLGDLIEEGVSEMDNLEPPDASTTVIDTKGNQHEQ
ncbi:DUF3775 domain-containing protein [Acidiphilium acidophilum]|uniref:DUF3775 domain-containing protein n=1 Tax=Acidiphilium acidophilum TaxID=76588 RepID=UPI002E8E67E4|nr:DUF3775 domain-containing protein [Acidiphilium acidophilum]